MYGPPFPPGGRGAAPPPPRQQMQHLNNNNNNLFQNPINPFLIYQNNHHNLFPQINPYLQNPHTFPPFQPHYPANRFPVPPNQAASSNTDTRPNNSLLIVEKLDKAAGKAHSDLLSSKESVSVWKVSQAALLAVQAESWESLGVQMQQVPSLSRLLVTAGKINAFIHCFVAVRRITSLYDLERAICESEGINRFEELDLGPLVRHSLVVHYFGVTSDVKEVCRITTEEIVSYLSDFLEIRKKKEVNVNSFLEFISEKKSVSGIGKLCVRIQNFGSYVSKIKEVRRSEDTLLSKCFDKIKTRVDKKCKKRPLFSAQKKQLDEHFSAISQRLKTFSSENQFGGQHTIFVSSSSEEDDSEDNDYVYSKEENNASNNTLPQPSLKSDHVSKCPYPSAIEEITRLGLRSETDFSSSAPDGGARYTVETELSNRKRRSENVASTSYSSRKLPRRDRVGMNEKHKSSEKEGNQEIDGYSLSNEALQSFVTTWKEACKSNNATEVLERMLQVYDIKRKKKVKALFTTFPFIGLLKAAVSYINSGMWDNMYDTFQAIDQPGVEIKKSDSSPDYISIAVEQGNEGISAPPKRKKVDVTAEDIVKEISGYLEDGMEYNDLTGENKLSFLRKICKCQTWLIERYSVNEFESLGYGEYFSFIEKYILHLPHALQKCLIGGTYEDMALDARLLPLQLDVLLSQAFNSFWENKNVSLQSVSELLARQFPLACMKLLSSHLTENFMDVLRKKVCKVTSNCVLFSTPLSKSNCPADSLILIEKKIDGASGYDYNNILGEGFIGQVTTKDAIEVLLKAPMLIDLNLWLHWDLSFAPLGSIVEWLLKEVNNKDLLCLVTKDGKVIRLDNSATLDSFLKVFIRGSPFETAVHLLSLYVIYGGEQNVPLSLLKCHAVKAFEVIIHNTLEKESDATNSLPNETVQVVSRFILDCLSYLPIEFCSFAADVLIAGVQSFVKGVPLAILNECKKIEQRLILHEVGLSLGLVEWVDDYNSFLSSSKSGYSPASSYLDVVTSKFNSKSGIKQDVLNKRSSSGELLLASEADSHELIHQRASGGAKLSDNLASNAVNFSVLDSEIDNDPVKVIKSIREEEFGLSESLSATENSMLEKQHARLGRALHCLSQELYSQDSHFLLELVQNADDNIYPGNVEPTLTFILQETGIIILNNEKGFSANNIRALCDVGNSTKKGRNAGYIGKKGIGFKSVFRVTDAPEIHSNGYHIKFDITEGQIGFVLPTIVPARDTDLYSRLASRDTDCMDQLSCNTCIVLPFRSNLTEGFSMNNIISMFSDLHPSVLLFLHRLQCIKLRNLLDDSVIVMRKEVLGDGMVQVALGNERMSWLVVSQKLKADVIRSDVPTTEISLAFTLQENDDGGYTPMLKQQPVFAFLPLRTYGLKFILQGDFVLPSSREEVDGSSPWNQWLLSEFPDLFLSAERSFCDLPCYRDNLGKAVAAFLSFIPLVGEVHGFFSSLPRMIVSKLRMSNCLLLEGIEKEWVPPCKVLRNWSEQTRSLLPDRFLQEHLGVGYLNKDIVLSDALARALGIEDYGPKILLRVISSLSHSENVLKSMGMSWLSSCLSAIYAMLCHSGNETSPSHLSESDFILSLKKIPFIPVLDGKFCSADEDTIWLHIEDVGHGCNDDYVLKAFPRLYTKLRIVSPNLLAAAASDKNSCSDATIAENVTKLLYKVGIQRLSAHEILKAHILPAISVLKTAVGEENLMVEYLSFVMFHLQSSCTTCSLERDGIITELHEKALILTNYGYKRSIDVPIHFSSEYRSSIDVNRLVSDLDMKWHEVDTKYLKHSITNTLSDGVLKWRTFFQDIGVTDFTRIVQVEKRVADMHWVDRDAVSVDSIVKDWESDELRHLLSQLSSKDDRQKSIYLMEIIDSLWNSYFSDKVAVHYIDSVGDSKTVKSSVVNMLQEIPWISSSMDDKLQYPKALFHDCVSVNSVLGAIAPYSIPKVRNEKLVADIGLKTQVTSDDALYVLQLWRRTQPLFKASLYQMSSFYGFLWKEMTISQKKIIKELHSGPFIFVPCTSSCSHDEAVSGRLLSCQEVYWHDSMEQVNSICLGFGPDTTTSIGEKLYNHYPTLHDFFVNECGVMENPPLRGYLQILLQLSRNALPHEAAKRVFEVFIKWADALHSGLLSLEDVEYLKESLLRKDYTVLPTRQDKWVSLHSSSGLICWYDDDILGKEFKNVEGVDFLYLGDSFDEEKQMIHAKLTNILQKLGIPALSEIVTREAIHYGVEDSSFFYYLLNWILPYAQRYINNVHPDKYNQLKQSDFENLRHLKIVVVEKLFYRNVIKRCEITSKKRHECDSLLQDNVLYCSKGSNPHAIFLEFSRLLYNGTPELHFANFLHMITTMDKSGSTEEQTEYFILNSQKIPKLPAEESPWFLQPALSSAETDATLVGNNALQKVEVNKSFFQGTYAVSSNWPPVDWKTAPGFNSSSTFSLKQPVPVNMDISEATIKVDDINLTDIRGKVNTAGDQSVAVSRAALLETEILEIPFNHSSIQDVSAEETELDSVTFSVPEGMNSARSNSNEGNNLSQLVGKLGEHFAFNYFVGKVGEDSAKWVNETSETGLPYDIILGNNDGNREYVEVKATINTKKNWFYITSSEWKMAVEKRESFSIAYVQFELERGVSTNLSLADIKMARVTVYKNPARLCECGNLKLAIVVPKE